MEKNDREVQIHLCPKCNKGVMKKHPLFSTLEWRCPDCGFAEPYRDGKGLHQDDHDVFMEVY